MPIGAARSGVRTLLDEYGLLVETLMVGNIEARQATIWGELVSLGPFPEADVAFELAPASEPLTASDRRGTATFDEPVVFSQTITGLEPETRYRVRAVATAQSVALSVSTSPPTELSAESATVEGNVEAYRRMSGFDYGEILEFTTSPILGVETLVPEAISADEATLSGAVTSYYPE